MLHVDSPKPYARHLRTELICGVGTKIMSLQSQAPIDDLEIALFIFLGSQNVKFCRS